MTDQLYLGLFVLFLAVIFGVVWMKLRAVNKDSRSSRLSASGRLANTGNFAKGQHRVPPSQVRKDVAADAHRSHEIWKSRRKRANEKRGMSSKSPDGMVYASYVHSDSPDSSPKTQDQSIEDKEYASIGEYLAKQELEASGATGDAGDLSMTAMKYEPEDSSKNSEIKQKKSGTKD